jgi:hypothetical protein
LAHLRGQVSHTILPLLTMSEVPSHVPVLSKLKHCPARRNELEGQEVQSDAVGPAHDAQRELQTRQELPDWKLPVPQRDGPGRVQTVGSVRDWTVPGTQVVQAVGEQALQPEPHERQFPLLESRKKPVSHVAHAVPLEALTHPVIQVQVPDELQEPFRQLHLEGAFEGSGVTRQAPVPDSPSSHLSQSLGHLEQLGPKKPFSQVSQEAPVNPAGQTHLPSVEHMALEEHAGEHVVVWMSLRVTEEAIASEGGS